MEEVSLDVMRLSYQAIQEVIRCAVCLETLRPEVVQCVRGHLLCGECRRKLRVCPTCRQPFSASKPPLVLCQILEALPKRCKYSNCRTALTIGDDHEKWCGYRLTCCKRNGCLWSGPGRDVLTHVRQQHASTPVFRETNQSVKFPRFDPPTPIKWVFPISAHGQFFWGESYCDNNKDLFVITFHSVPDGKPLGDYFIEVSFSSGELFSLSKFKFDFEQNVSKNSVFVSRLWLTNFFGNDQRLKLKLIITKHLI